MLSTAVLLSLTACGGGSSSGNPASIVISPATSAAVEQGAAFQITATPEDSSGAALSKFTPTFLVTSGSNLITVSISGKVCAGHWDSLTTPTVCTPPPLDSNGNPQPAGKATVTANVNSVASTPLIIDVLPPIDNLAIVGDHVDPDPAGLDCISQNLARKYTATATSKGKTVDLSNVTDAITWGTITGVGTVAVTTNATTGAVDSRSATVTAQTPGITQVTAGLFNIPGSPWLQSTPANFSTCPVSLITIADSTGATVSPSPLSPAATVTLTPTVTDSRGNNVLLTDAAGVSIFSLFWNSAQPSVASAASTGVITANASTGTSSAIASCTPPTCNAGLGAVYSNVYQAKVTGTVTTRIVYIGSITPTAGLTLLPMNTSDNTFGTAVTLGDVPNSMMFDPLGNNLYIGTNTGLIILAAGTTTPSTVGTGIPGEVIAISPDASTVLISNVATSQVFAYSVSAGTFRTYSISGAVAAAFAPDSSKAYIVGNNTLTIYSGGAISSPITISGAQSAAFLASGSLGFIAASDTSLGSKATCNDFVEGDISMPANQAAPTLVGALPDGQNILALAAPHLNLINVPTNNKGFVDSTHGCAPVLPTTSPTTLALNGGTTFTPKQLIVTPDGSKAFVLSNVGSLLGASISGTALTNASISLAGGAVPTTGGATLDSTTLYLGGSDGKVHQVNLSVTPATDTTIALPTTAPTGFTPDFVAVQPK